MSHKKEHPLTCTIDRFENSHAVLLFEYSKNNKAELAIPLRYLPAGIEEGEVLQIEFWRDAEATRRRENLAREILREILKGK